MRILPRKKDKKKKKDKKEKLVNTDYLKNAHRPSSLYEYAIKEYSNTVLPCQSNDDGSQSHVSLESIRGHQSVSVLNKIYSPPNVISPQQSNLRHVRSKSPQGLPSNIQSYSNDRSVRSALPPLSPSAIQSRPSIQPNTSPVRVPVDGVIPLPRRNSLPSFSDELSDDINILQSRSAEWSAQSHFSPDNFAALTSIQPSSNSELPTTANSRGTSSSNNCNDNNNNRSDRFSPPQTQYSDCSSPTAFQETATPPSISRRYAVRQQSTSSLNEPEMPDSTYEEYYGDAYVNKPIRYIYPSGYGNMRPRSFPWKISVLICGSFTWLTIFIVGHCSDQVDWDNYDYYDADNVQEMDDEVVIATRWCGSRALYFMWVLSVLITGMACSYCSIIGYIKARDFAVANGRSQPPGMAGKSDFYVRIDEHADVEEQGLPKDGAGGGGSGGDDGGKVLAEAKGEPSMKNIYQSDGTPRFLGGQIYRPTQAAVHLTSR